MITLNTEFFIYWIIASIILGCLFTWRDTKKSLMRKKLQLKILWKKKAPKVLLAKDCWGDPWIVDKNGIHSISDQGDQYGTPAEKARAQLLNSFRHGRCPHCGQLKCLLEGPSGGMSTNVICGACGSRFNDSGFIVDVQRDCTDPIPELVDETTKAPKRATHDRRGLIVRAASILHAEPENTNNETVPPAGGRRAAIKATKQKIAKGRLSHMLPFAR